MLWLEGPPAIARSPAPMPLAQRQCLTASLGDLFAAAILPNPTMALAGPLATTLAILPMGPALASFPGLDLTAPVNSDLGNFQAINSRGKLEVLNPRYQP